MYSQYVITKTLDEVNKSFEKIVSTLDNMSSKPVQVNNAMREASISINKLKTIIKEKK